MIYNAFSSISIFVEPAALVHNKENIRLSCAADHLCGEAP